MSRRIVTSQLNAAAAGAGAAASVDSYFDKLLKYIPADIVAAWMLVSSLIASATGVNNSVLMWIAFGVGVLLSALWTIKQTTLPGSKPAITQTLVATGAFIVWVFALGGPFAQLGFYRPLYGSLLLILYTLVVPLINPPEG